MKLHLPLSLRSAIYAMFAAFVGNVPTQAGIMHSDATLITYTDFGQNEGRYSVGVTNALLQHIRQQEGGVTITYTGRQATHVMPHGMIDFGSNYHDAAFAAISPSAVATCAHNYTTDYRWTSYFTGHVYGIGDSNAVKYKGIELGEGVSDTRWNSNVFSHALSTSVGNATDHRVMRLSKVITDAPSAEIYDTTGKNLSQLTYYHAGSGQQWRATYRTNTLVNKTNPNDATQLAAGYNYVIGGIVSGATRYAGSTGYYSQDYFDAGGINDSDPLTWVSRPGDSGSPLYVWDDVSGTYQYIGSNRGEILSGQVGSAFVIDTAFDKQVVEERYTKQVNMGAVSEVHLNAVSTQGGTVTDDKGNSTTKWLGTVTGEGMETVSFVGLESGLNTWSDLSGLKDTQAWYAYDESYVAQSNQDLFFTENLVFNATVKENNVVLNDTVDLGIGYAEFNGGKFTISSSAGESNLFNHAGYVINAGAEVHLQLTNPADYMREWRKIGAGDLYIEGSGNNDVLLNLGGSGKTYLNRNGGYAAYNVLVNTGATVVISDTEQIKRDLTFGNRGGTLDMNGKSMVWYTSAEEADSTRAGFSINALTEDALVANYSGSSTLTYKEAGTTTYAGSFADSADSSLKIVYDVAEGSWTLNSIRTNLQHEDSGLQVDAGRVILSGTNTVHGTGSATGRDTTRYFHEDDWHYADAKMGVRVTDGGTFELGSHARLTGDVTVESGGTYVMREGVRHTMEYVEGGQVLEDTGKYAAYFGHKGDVVLNGGTFAVQFGEGVDANTSYAGTVSGTGTLTVDTGRAGGSLTLSGSIASGVVRSLTRGQLVLTGNAAADSSVKWLVGNSGLIVVDTTGNMLDYVDVSSTGTLGLDADRKSQIDMSTHSSMSIGAVAGAEVQYGAAGTTEILTCRNLGGNGKLVVNFALSGSDALLVDGKGLSGEVQLNNVAADYNGTVNVQNENGRTTLSTGQDGALDNATVNVNTGGVYKLYGDHCSLGGTVKVNSGGMVQGDQDIAVSGTVIVNEDGVLQGENAVTISGSAAVNDGGVLRSENSVSISGEVAVNTGGLLQGRDIVVTGSVSLAGTLDYNSFTVRDGGELVMESSGTFDEEYAVTIADGGTLNLNKTAFTQKVNLADGGVILGQSSHIESGSEVIVSEGTGTIDAGTSMEILGYVGAQEGATLVLAGTQVDVNTKTLNASGGSLELQCAKLSIGNDVQSIEGTLSIGADMTLSTELCTRSANPRVHSIETLEVLDNHKLTILQTKSSEAHVWNVGEIAGNGEILWSVSPYHHRYGVSRMVLSGENSFAGTLKMRQNYGWAASYPEWSRLAQLVLAHDGAARNMVISVEDSSNVNRPGIAINTQNAHVQGLNSIGSSDLYAGSAITSGNMLPTSTELNTLTVTGGGTYSFAGDVHGTESYGLNIVMAGSGSQSFTGASNVVHDVTVLQGSLAFTNGVTVYGDVSIVQGAELTLGSGAFSLEAGQTLKVLSGSTDSSATLNNGLILNGGIIDIGAYNDNGEASLVLNNGSISYGSGVSNVTIGFSNRSNIVEQQKYLLMGGDWSRLDISAESCPYLNTTFDKSLEGLYATFTLKEGYDHWRGDQPDWRPNQNTTVVVTGLAQQSEVVNVKDDYTINTGIIDNSGTVTIQSDGGHTLTYGVLDKYSEGELVINSAVSAGTMSFHKDSTISGSAALAVNNLVLDDEVKVSLIGGTLQLGQSISSSGSLYVGKDGVLQVPGALDSMVYLGDGATLRSMGSTVSNLSLGDAGVDNRVTLQFMGSSLAMEGPVNVQGNTTLVAEGRGALSFNSAFNNLKALELKTGVSLNQTTALTTHLVLDGGTATASGKQNLQGDITVNTGSTLQFVNGDDVLDYSKNKAIKVNGGTLDFGSTRQTLANWGLELADGAVVSGDGSTYSFDNASRQAALDISTQDTTIKVTSGNNTISARTRLRYGNNLIYDVAQGATLDVSGQVHADEAASKGSITKSGAGTLILSNGANTYANTTTVNGGILSASVEGALGTSKLVINDGGTALIGGNNNKLVASNVTVNRGGLLSFVGSGADMLDYSQQNKSITVDGGTLDFGNTRQTIGSWGITLKNGGTITGTGGNYDATTYAAAMDFNNNARIIVESGENNTIESNMRLRYGNSRTLSFDVAEGAGLIVSGRIHADTNAALGNLVKEGAGSMNISSQVMLDTITNKSGELKLTHTEAQNVVRLLDSSKGKTCNGSLRLAENVDLKVTGQIWTCANSEYVLDKGASLTSTQDGVIISNRSGAAETRISIAAADGEYTVANSNYELSNAYVQYDTSQEGNLKNKLTHSTVANVNRGGKTLTVSHADNTLSGLRAETGAINVLNQENLSLEELYIAASLEVSVVTTGEGVAFNAANEASVAVVGMAEFGDGATLKANLKMTAGSELKLGGTVHMGSSLELVSNGLEAVTLSGGMLIQVQSMKAGDTLTVFTGVDELILTHNGSSTYYAPGTLTTGSGVLASTYFENLRDTSVADTLFMTFTNDVNGAGGDLVFAMVPEPATTSLSILALSALAARRRRK